MANEALRRVVLRGPQWSDGTPMWEITAASPKLKKQKDGGLLEDRIHPLRMLSTDALSDDVVSEAQFRRPHALSLHVLAGHGSGPYAPNFERLNGSYKDTLYETRSYPDRFTEYRGDKPSDPDFQLCLEGANEWLVLSAPVQGKAQPRPRKIFGELRWRRKLSRGKDMPPYFYTRAEHPDDLLPAEGKGERVAARFQHVVAEPILAPEEAWPKSSGDALLAPAFGLVAGAVSLAVAHGALPWLGDLEPKRQPSMPGPPLSIKRYPIRLVPDGIELRTTVNLLGRYPLEGWFHLGVGGEGLVLTLLKDRTEAAGLLQAWRSAWMQVMPADGTQDRLQGFRVERVGSDVPAFRWHLPPLTSGAPDPADFAPGNNAAAAPKIRVDFAKLPVIIDAAFVRVDLLSPRDTAMQDGNVKTEGGSFTLAPPQAMAAALYGQGSLDAHFKQFTADVQSQSLVLAWSSPELPKEPKSQWRVKALGQASTAEVLSLDNAGYRCAHNSRRLAATLRDAYGLPVDANRKVLQGFVPLRDGWLQVPLPDSPPYDPSQDSADFVALAAPRENILQGFLRFGNAGTLPPLYSAFAELPPGPLVKEAPWSVTVEGAARLRIAIEVGTDSDGQVAPLRGLALFDEPELSMRGLLWISGDRPDPLEAIPRMGAGPGAFIDVPLDRLDKEPESEVDIALRDLKVEVKTSPQGHVSVARSTLALALTYQKPPRDVGPVRWQRHPWMPLAAQMPLTRSARSAVRPMESRDLVPFEARKPATDAMLPLADLVWQGGESLPRMAPGWSYELVRTGPFGEDRDPAADPGEEASAESQVCRLTWAAFGVPGVEILPLEGGESKWKLLAAHRFDLPVNDEAYATATLPAAMGGDVPEPPTATALDWDALAAHWEGLRRLLQLARVSHCYLSGFINTVKSPSVEVEDLVGGLKWGLSALGFEVPAVASVLPYGAMRIGDDLWSGNRALLGHSGLFSIGNGYLHPSQTAAPEAVSVVGYSPSSFLIGDFLHDARKVGAAQTKMLHSGASRWRAISSPTLGEFGLFSLVQPISVVAGTEDLKLWLKDLPIDLDGAYLDKAGALNPEAWQDGQLEMRGLEWRLTSSRGDELGFAIGDDAVEFFGLRLKPLRLAELRMTMAAGAPTSPVPLSATLVASIELGARREDVDDGGNLIEVQLVRKGAGMVVQNVVALAGAPLRFSVALSRTAQEEARRANLEVEAKEVKWASSELQLAQISLGFEYLGSRVRLPNATSTRDGDGLLFSWTAPSEPPVASLGVMAAQLHVGSEAEFRFAHRLRLSPTSVSKVPPTGEAPLRFDSATRWGEAQSAESTPWQSALQQAPRCEVQVLGATSKAIFAPAPRSLAVVARDAKSEGALLPGFPIGGALNLGLIAGTGSFDDSVAPLETGALSGNFTWADADSAGSGLRLASITLAADCNLRMEHADQSWAGQMTLNGEVAGVSAIAWPRVKRPENPTVPFPPDTTTITEVSFDHRVWYRHDVRWLLREHTLAFETASGLLANQAAVWSVAAMARHTLQRVDEGGAEEEVLTFSSIDSLSLAPLRAIAPPWPKGGDAADLKRSSTFAARYKTGSSGKPDPGMDSPGRGAPGLVLQGFEGALFRQAYYEPERERSGDELVFLGGFTGVVAKQGADEAPLLRLPALVALGGDLQVDASKHEKPPIGQSGVSEIPVAWADGFAADEIVVPWRAAAASLTTAQPDIEQAITASTRRPPDPRVEAVCIANAIMVEQCFPVGLDGKYGLAGTPYFIGSAVSLARALEHIGRERTVVSLSILSRVHRVGRPAKAYRQGSAAILRASLPQTALTDGQVDLRLPDAALFIVGDDCTRTDWSGGSPDDTEAVDGRFATVAAEMHRRPRLAMVRDASGRHTVIALPYRQLRPHTRSVPKLLYADAARGFMLDPDPNPVMAGPEEGWTAAIRDVTSGLAATSRVASLPAHAQGIKAEGSGNGQAVWLTQQRVPVYLPFSTSIASEAIAWLDAGSARIRVPVSDEIDRALARVISDARWQGVVPEQAMAAAVSDRPGIMMARRMRLEMKAPRQVDGADAFDPAFARFGSPGQASSSHPRTERTPRPGVLPPNSEDMSRNRRPCASPLRTTQNSRAVQGPADSVRGLTAWVSGSDHQITAWSMNFMPAPHSSGVICDPWDGTLDLVVEVDLADEGVPEADIARYVFAFAMGAQDDGGLLSSASVIVNGTEFPFASIQVRKVVLADSAETTRRRGQVWLVLDMRSVANATMGIAAATSALSSIRDSIASSVEIRLTLHPMAALDGAMPPMRSRYELGAGQRLPRGSDRPPVTLRMPLFAVTRERGALPLEPATVLFMDPAYDASLASPPVEHAERISPPDNLPTGRGDLLFVLSADRGRINRRGTVVFMVDLRFEKRLPSNISELLGGAVDDVEDGSELTLELVLRLQPRAGEQRQLFVADRTSGGAPLTTKIDLAAVYELPLATLVETDGTPARLSAGDILEVVIQSAASDPVRVKVLNAGGIGTASKWTELELELAKQNRTVRLVLTDEPIVEPPPALYAAMLRTALLKPEALKPVICSLSLPLYAQSPLPWRVDIPNARSDFRKGLMHRSATFVWSLLRPADESGNLSVFVVKSDRNGQTYLPEEDSANSDFQLFDKLVHLLH